MSHEKPHTGRGRYIPKGPSKDTVLGIIGGGLMALLVILHAVS